MSLGILKEKKSEDWKRSLRVRECAAVEVWYRKSGDVARSEVWRTRGLQWASLIGKDAQGVAQKARQRAIEQTKQTKKTSWRPALPLMIRKAEPVAIQEAQWVDKAVVIEILGDDDDEDILRTPPFST